MKNKIAVLLYLYDTALWDEYKKLLTPISDNIDLFLALSKDNFRNNNLSIIEDANNNFSLADSIICVNKGADIGPFLKQIQKLDENTYPIFIKLHSKNSLWGEYKNISWRSLLVHSLIGSQEIFQQNIYLMNNKNIGTIGNTGLLLGRDKEGFNTELIFYILHKHMNIPIEQIARQDLSFLAGSIFMSKTSIFKKYFTNNIIDQLYNLFPEGLVYDNKNGQIAHSLERIFGYIINISDYQFANGYIDRKIKLIHKDNTSKYDIVLCYDNTCYVNNNILMAGTSFNISDKYMMINWKHNNKNGFWKKYTKIKKDLYYG